MPWGKLRISNLRWTLIGLFFHGPTRSRLLKCFQSLCHFGMLEGLWEHLHEMIALSDINLYWRMERSSNYITSQWTLVPRRERRQAGRDVTRTNQISPLSCVIRISQEIRSLVWSSTSKTNIGKNIVLQKGSGLTCQHSHQSNRKMSIFAI